MAVHFGGGGGGGGGGGLGNSLTLAVHADRENNET